ncbi:hypothetical protein [Marinivivus vitaminiproducens]|uniref:hypothetical protein n=1 Tax=Marinivivus vitaminiproducens TaxID=3035935 RepID=UPI0027A21C33|nr:hypothetical protein P4R82_24810 [Geminicoccaceae bacterium SCSIO 64248]
MPFQPAHSALAIGLILIATGTLGVEHYRTLPAEGEALAVGVLAILLGFVFAMGFTTANLMVGRVTILSGGLWLAAAGAVSLCVTTDPRTLTTPFAIGPMTAGVLATLAHVQAVISKR